MRWRISYGRQRPLTQREVRCCDGGKDHTETLRALVEAGAN